LNTVKLNNKLTFNLIIINNANFKVKFNFDKILKYKSINYL